jgi:hypothetical protein
LVYVAKQQASLPCGVLQVLDSSNPIDRKSRNQRLGQSRQAPEDPTADLACIFAYDEIPVFTPA